MVFSFSMDSFATNPWIAWWGHCLSKVSPDVKFSSNTVIGHRLIHLVWDGIFFFDITCEDRVNVGNYCIRREFYIGNLPRYFEDTGNLHSYLGTSYVAWHPWIPLQQIHASGLTLDRQCPHQAIHGFVAKESMDATPHRRYLNSHVISKKKIPSHTR
jgi:hypothetical protein